MQFLKKLQFLNPEITFEITCLVQTAAQLIHLQYNYFSDFFKLQI